MKFLVATLLAMLATFATAEPVQVAVATNFASPLKQLVAHYEKHQPDADIQLTIGSTGKLAVQIRQGAPYDIFLAADDRRPAELAREGLLQADSVRTYARGILVLWTPKPGVPLGPEVLREGLIQPLALANARTAPYGQAAESVLAALSVPDAVPRVRGENVGQSYHFAHSGAAAAAFVALSQVINAGGSQWRVPDTLYSPIVQQGGRLSDREDVVAFFDFLFSETARDLIMQNGYRVGGADAE